MLAYPSTLLASDIFISLDTGSRYNLQSKSRHMTRLQLYKALGPYMLQGHEEPLGLSLFYPPNEGHD